MHYPARLQQAAVMASLQPSKRSTLRCRLKEKRPKKIANVSRPAKTGQYLDVVHAIASKRVTVKKINGRLKIMSANKEARSENCHKYESKKTVSSLKQSR
jgi:hypothetical protein